MAQRAVGLDDSESHGKFMLGGKGESLARLVTGGFPVPAGFIITGEAYFDYLKDGNLENQIKRHLSTGYITDPERLTDVSSRINDLFTAENLPRRIRKEISNAYWSLGSRAVAVRSSASAEDLPGSSFAGLHDTFLNISGERSLFEAVVRCWASLWNPEAIAYRDRNGFDHLQVAMCVVVQEMIASRVAGVMFTVNPSGDTGEVLIEAVWGLGESLVSGRASPDSFTIEKETGAVKTLHLGVKDVTIDSAGEHETPDDTRAAQTLSERELDELVALGRRVENYFRSPQDIEWAITDKIYILQSRPITAFSDRSEIEELAGEERERLRNVAGGELVVWTSKDMLEVFPAPLPMTWSILSGNLARGSRVYEDFLGVSAPKGKAMQEQDAVELICARPYFNVTGIAEAMIGDLPLKLDLESVEESGYTSEGVSLLWASDKVGWHLLLELPKYLRMLVVAYARFMRERKTYYQRYYSEVLPTYRERINGERKLDIGALSDKALLAKTLEWIDLYSGDAFRPHLESEIFIFTRPLVQQNLVWLFGAEGDAMMTRLLRGLDGNVNVETNVDLWRLSRGEMTLDDFLEKYGHRTGYEMELGNPRWRENPGFVIDMANALREVQGLDAERQFETQKEDRLEAERETRSKLRRRPLGRILNPLRWHFMAEIKYLQIYVPLRETSKINALMAGELARNGLLELGKRSGLGQDIFYLLPSELEPLIEGTDLIEVVSGRKRRRDLLLKIDVPLVVRSDRLDEIGNPPPPVAANELEGLSVSTGIAEGVARVILDPSEAQALDQGQILVAPATDPAWSPLFLNAGGLVMDTGGVLSHGSIIAREYGIPAVVNVSGATRIIKDGQKIHVDSNRGKVIILENPEASEEKATPEL